MPNQLPSFSPSHLRSWISSLFSSSSGCATPLVSRFFELIYWVTVKLGYFALHPVVGVMTMFFDQLVDRLKVNRFIWGFRTLVATGSLHVLGEEHRLPPPLPLAMLVMMGVVLTLLVVLLLVLVVVFQRLVWNPPFRSHALRLALRLVLALLLTFVISLKSSSPERFASCRHLSIDTIIVVHK